MYNDKMVDNDDTVDYKKMYQQVVNDNEKLRIFILKMTNMKKNIDPMKEKVKSFLGNPVKLSMYSFIALVVLYAFSIALDAISRNRTRK